MRTDGPMSFAMAPMFTRIPGDSKCTETTAAQAFALGRLQCVCSGVDRTSLFPTA